MTEKTIGRGLIGASTITREWMVESIRGNGDSRTKRPSAETYPALRPSQLRRASPPHTALWPSWLENPKIDVVYISSTNERHLYEALAAASAGKHILCEKPLALEPDKAE
jgi:1,5-anhydro-D-fructose reductase (1,5-anhydro-D-mannitol-forming)